VLSFAVFISLCFLPVGFIFAYSVNNNDVETIILAFISSKTMAWALSPLLLTLQYPCRKGAAKKLRERLAKVEASELDVALLTEEDEEEAEVPSPEKGSFLLRKASASMSKSKKPPVSVEEAEDVVIRISSSQLQESHSLPYTLAATSPLRERPPSGEDEDHVVGVPVVQGLGANE